MTTSTSGQKANRAPTIAESAPGRAVEARPQHDAGCDEVHERPGGSSGDEFDDEQRGEHHADGRHLVAGLGHAAVDGDGGEAEQRRHLAGCPVDSERAAVGHRRHTAAQRPREGSGVGRRPAAWSAARTRAPVRASSSALARSLANTMGGRHQNTSSSGSTSDRCRVRMPRLPMLANATPKVTTHSAANTRYGVVSISLGACASRRQLTMPTSSSAVISSAGSAAASPRASKSSGRVRVRNAARGQSCGPSTEIGSNDEPPWVVCRLDLVEDVGEPVGDDCSSADDLVGVVVGGVEVAERDLGDDDEADAGDGEQQDRAELAAASFVGATVRAAHHVERDAGDEGDHDRPGPDGGEVRPHVGGADEPDGEQHEAAHGTTAAGEHERGAVGATRRGRARRRLPCRCSSPSRRGSGRRTRRSRSGGWRSRRWRGGRPSRRRRGPRSSSR